MEADDIERYLAELGAELNNRGEYILAFKIAAGRDKDLADCAILLPQTKIRTREQAQQLLERYLSPLGREKNAELIEGSLHWLFERKEGQP